MSAPQTQIDANEVTQNLGQQIAELSIALAMARALVGQKDATIGALRVQLQALQDAAPADPSA